MNKLEQLIKGNAIEFITTDGNNNIYKGRYNHEWVIQNKAKNEVFVNLLPNIDFDKYPKHASIVYKKLAFIHIDNILVSSFPDNAKTYLCKYYHSVDKRQKYILEMLNSNTDKNYIDNSWNIADILNNIGGAIDDLGSVIRNSNQ